MAKDLNWIEWHGGNWDRDPETLVYVKLQSGQCDEDMEPLPASWWGAKPNEPSNWRRRFDRSYDATIRFYALAPQVSGQ